MKTLKYIFTILVMASFIACSSDDDNNQPVEDNVMQGYHKLYEFASNEHQIEIYSDRQQLEVGYNDLFIRVKDLNDNHYVSNAEIQWTPTMNMVNMHHSAPHSGLDNSENSSVYKGHIVFQMAENAEEHWALTLDFKVNGQSITETHPVSVKEPADGMKKLQVFMGDDNKKYVLAYLSPKTPKVAINDMEAVLYTMESMMSFPVVEEYSIAVDPRMPGMGNHSAPNSQDLTYDSVSSSYKGKLSLTMTGYWKINMKLLDRSGEVVKGEDVDENNESSSLYFQIEF